MVSQILAANQRNVFPSPPYQRLTRAYTRDLRSRARALVQLDDKPEDLGAKAILTDAPVVLFGAEKPVQNDQRGMTQLGFMRLMQCVCQAQPALGTA